MAERRAKFEKQFKHVWSSGPTGVSMVHYTLDDSNSADELLKVLFKDTLIADAF